MVVADLDFMRSVRAPDEANSPSVVDSDAVLSGAVASEALQSVSRRTPEISERGGRIQEEKLPVRLALYLRSQPWNSLSLEDPQRQGVPEAPDQGGRL